MGKGKKAQHKQQEAIIAAQKKTEMEQSQLRAATPDANLAAVLAANRDAGGEFSSGSAFTKSGGGDSVFGKPTVALGSFSK